MKIFISYRRSDSEGHARSLYGQLTKAFGEEDVFFDVESIAPGEDFVDVIERVLGQVRVMLVLIGPQWASVTDSAGTNRLNQPADFVRIEISHALKRGLTVIPVLVGAGEMPKAESLPPDLLPLAHKNAIWVRHNSFRQDAKRLIEVLAKHVGQSTTISNEEFARAIVAEYNEYFVLQWATPDARLQLYFGSETSPSTDWKSYLQRDAIIQLIEIADTSFWMKFKEELQPDEFWKSILRSIAASVRVDLPPPLDELNDADTLRLLIDDL